MGMRLTVPERTTGLRRVAGLFAAVFCLFFMTVPDVTAVTPVPAVTGPIPVTRESYPFNAADHKAVPQDLSKWGYVEEEYFVNGLANVYDVDGAGKVRIRTAHAPYTTRILVRRPVSPTAFSGTVVVELLNPTALVDLDIQWQFSCDYFLAHKDIWVGITAKPVTAKALQVFDGKRYASLSWANPLPPEKTCAQPVSLFPDSTPATENGLVWDITSQVGALLKSKGPGNPLKGFAVERVYLTGYSQTGGYLVTYINLVRPRAVLDGGKPVYDGYLIGDGDALAAPINQCPAGMEAMTKPGTGVLKAGDPATVIRPRPEPVITVESQSLLALSVPVRRPDSDALNDRYRRYEVPGSSHISARGRGYMPSKEDVTKAGVKLPGTHCKETTVYGVTDFPFEYIINGAFANLDAWVKTGMLPPKGAWINTMEKGPLLGTDLNGNATGGVRTPYLDVPVATYFGSSTPEDPSASLGCLLAGYKMPFTAEKIKGLYPRRLDYTNRFARSVNRLLKQRWITKEDGERMKDAASRVELP